MTIANNTYINRIFTPDFRNSLISRERERERERERAFMPETADCIQANRITISTLPVF